MQNFQPSGAARSWIFCFQWFGFLFLQDITMWLNPYTPLRTYHPIYKSVPICNIYQQTIKVGATSTLTTSDLMTIQT